MTKTEQRVQVLVRKLTKAQEQKARAKGVLMEIRRTLKRDFDLDSVKEAKQELRALRISIKRSEQQLEAKLKEVETRYDWNSIT